MTMVRSIFAFDVATSPLDLVVVLGFTLRGDEDGADRLLEPRPFLGVLRQ